jgi:serine/threonine protein kinase
MQSTGSSSLVPSIESLSFSYDDNLVGEIIASAPGIANFDDDFDLSQFDWILRRSVALGVQDHSQFYRTELQQVGEGTNFKVYRCMTQLSLEPNAPEAIVALKRLKAEVYVGRLRASSREQDALKSLLREVYTMSALAQHPNILNIFGFGSDYLALEDLSAPDIFAYRPFLVVEFAPLGTLADYLGILYDGHFIPGDSPTRTIPMDVRIGLCIDIRNGVRALHHQGFIHRDIKPHNALVFQDEQGSVTAKLSDFGLTLFYGSDVGSQFNVLQYFAGSERYAAPEVANRSTAELTIEEMRKGDIFSFGVTCFECLSSTQYNPVPAPSTSNAQTTLLAQLEPALEHATDLDRWKVQQLMNNTFCDSATRSSTLDEILDAPGDADIHSTTNHDSVLETQGMSTQWPEADSITANVFSQTNWQFLDGDEELTVSTWALRFHWQVI